MYKKVVNGMRPCITCKTVKPMAEFCQYPYTTKQGKPSTRSESRCMACARERRLERYNATDTGEVDRATSARWKELNSHRLVEYRKERQADPLVKAQKATAQRRRKAKLRAGTTTADTAEIKAIYRKAVQMQSETGVKYHVDHIHPLKHGGQHHVSNLQILTATENMKKGARIIRSAVTMENKDA